jgi:hypothetical protein
MGAFLLESIPERRLRRYGDAEYDWNHRVDTTSATVGWCDRLLGAFHSPYRIRGNVGEARRGFLEIHVH